MTHTPLMIQGTSSSAGKTTLVAGLCRLLSNRGLRVAPFKSQNMALNSYATRDGEEIARSLAVQAQAARQTPIVHMNPILLKPKADDVCQLIVHGRPHADVTARDYFDSDRYQALKLEAIDASIRHLRASYDIIVAEGAGSCAEPNLRARDVVNMGLAERLGARVFVVTDIDKGGVFADILGTLEILRLTAPADLSYVEGFLINKFRGDRSILDKGIDFIAGHAARKVLGVLPYLPLRLEEEDRVRPYACAEPEIDVAVLYLPHIANATDLDGLAAERGVRVRFVRSVTELGLPDAIVLPGSKNTIWDLRHLERIGIAAELRRQAGQTPLFGICGGFEMLGERLVDEGRSESELGSIDGLGLFAIDFHFAAAQHKVVRQCRYLPAAGSPFAAAGAIEGYEIHTGQAVYRGAAPLFKGGGQADGAIDAGRLLAGTFVHDVFANAGFTRSFVNWLRARKGLPALSGALPRVVDDKEAQYEILAQALDALQVF